MPWLYFDHIETMFNHAGVPAHVFLYSLLCLTVVLESLRLALKIIVPGQRVYERHTVCSAAWGLIGFILVVLFVPSKGLAFAICITAGVVDPLIGELKRVSSFLVSTLTGLAVAWIIWWVIAQWFAFSPLYGMCLAPLAVVLEMPQWRYIDDNFLMLLGPLLAVLLVELLSGLLT